MKSLWRPIRTAPFNKRILVAQDGRAPDDEMAMAWRDRMNDTFYYAPNSGIIGWKPTHWRPLPAGPPLSLLAETANEKSKL